MNSFNVSFLQGYLWDANCSSHHSGLLHLAGTVKTLEQKALQLKWTRAKRKCLHIDWVFYFFFFLALPFSSKPEERKHRRRIQGGERQLTEQKEVVSLRSKEGRVHWASLGLGLIFFWVLFVVLDLKSLSDLFGELGLCSF